MMGCKKDDEENNDNPNNNNPVGSMSLKVDGTSWTASLAVVATNSGGLVTVTGSDSNAHQAQVTIYNVSGTGTYQLGGSMTNPNMGRWTAGVNPEQTYTTSLGLGSGTVEITELTDTNVAGTFSFTAKNSNGDEVSITEGSFNAAISQ